MWTVVVERMCRGLGLHTLHHQGCRLPATAWGRPRQVTDGRPAAAVLAGKVVMGRTMWTISEANNCAGNENGNDVDCA
jgi:hypothetical protein